MTIIIYWAFVFGSDLPKSLVSAMIIDGDFVNVPVITQAAEMKG